MRKITFVLCSIIAMQMQSWACTITVTEKSKLISTLIDQNEDILLAKALKLHANGDMEFEIIEALKGQMSGKFKLQFGHFKLSDENDRELLKISYHDHKQINYWEKTNGRTDLGSDCRPVTSFQIGQNYLLFPSYFYSQKMFELILSNDDRWLRTVRSYLNDPKEQFRPLMGPKEILNSFAFAISVRMNSCTEYKYEILETYIYRYIFSDYRPSNWFRGTNSTIKCGVKQEYFVGRSNPMTSLFNGTFFISAINDNKVDFTEYLSEFELNYYNNIVDLKQLEIKD